MRRRRGLFLCVVLLAMLVAGSPPVGADATQFTLFDSVLTHKIDMSARANAAAPSNWMSPVNYSDGRVYLRLEVTAKPSDLDTLVQLCLWRNSYVDETCSGSHPVATIGTYWIDFGTPSTWWKTANWNWTQPFDVSAIMVKDRASGALLMDGSCGVHCYEGPLDVAAHTPIVFRATSIVVAKNATLNAPGWTGCPSSWTNTCTGGVGNRAPTADAGPDRTVAPGAFHTALKARVEDDGLPSNTISGTWSKVSGPATVTFSAPNSAATSATFGQTGTYELAYRASDGKYADSDTVLVVVPTGGTPPPQNRTAHLLVGNATSPVGGDSSLRARLVANGFDVTLVDDDALSSSSTVSGSDLVVVSASVNATLVPSWLADLAVPVLSNEWGAQATLRLGSAPQVVSDQTTLAIAVGGHPLAAGLSGNKVVSGLTSFGSVNAVAPGATVVARLVGSTRIAIFGVQTGAALVSGTAAARRVGFFLAPAAAPKLNTNGWKLFDAAVAWLAPAEISGPVQAGGTPSVSSAQWWDADWGYRMPVTLSSPTSVADSATVEFGLDFTSALDELSVSNAFDPDSIRVVEVNGSGVVTNANVVFQFDEAPGFDADTYAVGTVVVQLNGPIAPASARTLHVYFDTVNAAIAAATFPSQVAVSATVDAGMAAFRITTPGSSWFLQPANGGLSSLLDVANQDWLSYSPTSAGAGGAYRGMPNSVFPEGYSHPGFTGATTTELSSGPLKASFRSVTADGWRYRWDFFSTHTVMVWEQTPRAYWFLYEGTPGGQIDLSTDRVIFSDGINIPLTGSRTGDLPGPEWVGFADTVRHRSLFVRNLAEDPSSEEYWLMDQKMTVFGFGRLSSKTKGVPSGTFRPMLTGPQAFVIGLTEGDSFSTIQSAVNAASTRPATTVVALDRRS